MSTRSVIATTSLAVLATVAAVASDAGAASTNAGRQRIPFADARLKIEYNATDGDAGLQVFVDAEPWRQIIITNPSGRDVVDVEAEDVIRNYGLTELFSESSEPPFDEFPFEEFKRLFPEGRYTFTGLTVEGQRLRSTFQFSHTVPDAPEIRSPRDGAVVGRRNLVVQWAPVTTPAGVDVVAYQVLVVADTPFVGNPTRVLDVMLPASVNRLPVPAEFLVPGTYKTEVLAIDRTGNQTLTEVAFTIG
jgi:hypothetical protein